MTDIPPIFRGCKVAILGSRRSGKTWLTEALTSGTYVPASDLVNISVHHLRMTTDEGEVHEISLWDFSGHDGYRVIHELILDDVDVVIITIDRTKAHDDEEFEAIAYWNSIIVNKIQKKQAKPIRKFLVATKADNVRRRKMNEPELQFVKSDMGFDDVHMTSSETGQGVDDLLSAIYYSVDWETQIAIDYVKLQMLEQLIDARYHNDVILDRHQLYIEFLDVSQHLVSTTEYDTLLNALQYRGSIFQIPMQDHVLLDLNIFERYVASILELPRRSELQLSQNQEFFPVKVQKILEHPIPVPIAFPVGQHNRLNGLILYYLAFRNLLILDNYDVIFLSNLVQDRSIDKRAFSGALVLDMRLFPSLNYPQLIVRVNRSERYKLVEYWSNHAVFKSQYTDGEEYPHCRYQIIQPEPHPLNQAPQIWIYCSEDTPHDLRLLFETYVYDLITDMGNLATLEKHRHYVCYHCRSTFTPDQLQGKAENVRCIVCGAVNQLLIRPSQLPYEQQLHLLQEAEQIVKKSVVLYDKNLAKYKIELSRMDGTIDCLMIFERESDVYEQIIRVADLLRQDGLNTVLLPTRGMEGVDLDELDGLLDGQHISRIVYFVGNTHQIQVQMGLINRIFSHYQPLKFYFLVAAIHPTIINTNHPLISRGFNVVEWSPHSDPLHAELLNDIRDNRLKGVEAVHGRLNTPALQEFPYLGQAIFPFFSIDNISPAFVDAHNDDVLKLLIPKDLELSQFWFAHLNIQPLRINRPESLIYFRRSPAENEAKLVTKLRIHYKVEFVIIIDVNDLPPIEIRGNVKVIHVYVKALQNLLTTGTQRDGWFRRYLVRNMQGGGAKFIEKMLKFDINKAASDADVFFGRNDLIHEIKREMRMGNLRGRFIFGPMRSGKTSLLHRINEHLLADDIPYTPVMVTVGGFLSIESFIDHVLRKLDINNEKTITPVLWIHLMETYKRMTGNTPVLLMDEMDYLLRMDSEQDSQFRSAIRLLHERKACVFFLAGHAILRNAVSQHTGNLSDMMETYYASGIEEDAAEALLQEIMKQVDLEFTDEQIRNIYIGTGGIPYLMIYFCQELFNTMVSNDDDHESTFDRYVQDFEVDRVVDNQGYLSKVVEYFMYDHHEFLEIILKIIAKSDKITPEDIIIRLSNLPNARTEAKVVFSSLLRFQIVQEITIERDTYFQIKPRFLHHAFNKGITKHKTLDEMETHLRSET